MLNLAISLSGDGGNRAFRKNGGRTRRRHVRGKGGRRKRIHKRTYNTGSRMSYAKIPGRFGAPAGIATALVFTVSGITTAYGDEAADESLPALQEITVTATRQAQPLSKVPVSVAVETAAMLEQRDIR